MSFAAWIRQLRRTHVRRDQTHKSRHNYVPQLERLEDKIVPSTMEPTYVLHEGIGASTGPTGYSPLQLRTAYGVNSVVISGSPGTGAGQTIAIVDAYNDPNIVSDLDTFDQEFSATSGGSTLYSQFGAASTFLTVFNESGTAITPSTNATVPVDSTGGWEMEEALDVEWAHSMAPGAKIDLIEANSDSSSDLYTAVKTAAGLSGVSVVSMSWGSTESSSETSNDGVFTTPAGHQGVTFVAAAGDESVGEYPAFSPNVIAVGGTTLTLNSSNGIASETAWSTGSDSYAPADGTGGGTSSVEPEPAYQDGVQSTGHRTIPDVAFDADPNTGVAVYDSYKNSGWTEVGGTSLGAPSISGIMALANEGRTAAGLGTFNSSTNSQQALTALYSMPSSDFHDITSGQITANGVTYKAGPGYDEVSGLGSPAANNLVAGLASYGSSGTVTASQLAFTTEPPSSIAAGTAFSTVVQLESSGGADVSLANVSVTITLSSGTFSNGATTMTTTTNGAGQASFSVVVSAGGSYSLTATSTNLTSATSSGFTETVSASKLVFTSEPPSSVAVGTPFTTVVQLESSSGASISQANVNVTITLSSGTFSNGQTTMSALTNSSGQASFSVVMSATGSYTLAPSASGLTGAASTSFAVTSSATELAFSTQPPSSVAAGTAFTTVVQLQNSSGTAVPQSGVTVILAISSGSFASGSVTTAVTNTQGQATFSVIVDTVGPNYTLTASATPVSTKITSPASTAFSVTGSSDWFSQHISDAVLQNLARTDFQRDGAITYSDMLGLFSAAEAEGATLSSTTYASLVALVAGANTLDMPAYVSNLASKVVDGDPANATYQSLNSSGNVVTINLGNLAAGSSSTQLAELVNKWFLGVDEPAAGTSYSAVSGVLFGSGGPSYADVFQGTLGDCTVLASMAEVAARDNSAIAGMFIYDGTNTINGASVGDWTVRFFDNGTATYVTVDGELPAGGTLYDQPENGVLWVALAEKAYVEVNQSGWLGTLSPGSNSYQAINSGSEGTIAAALSALTGMSSSGFSMNANTVAADMAAGKLVVIATGNMVADANIVNNHAYAVIGYNPYSSLPFTVFSPWGINGGYENGVYKWGEFIANAAFLNQNFVLGVGAPSEANFRTGGNDVQNNVNAELTRSGDQDAAPLPPVAMGVTEAMDTGVDAGLSGHHEDALQWYLDGGNDLLLAALADEGDHDAV
jgi:hypothetical protein